MDWTQFVLGMLGGLAGSLVYRFLGPRLSQPYRWRCPEPGCTLFVTSSNRQFLESYKPEHLQSHYPTQQKE